MLQKVSRVLALLLVMLLLASGPAPAVAQGPAELKLPAGAIKISEAVPAMGEHWANPKDLPLGPIYLVWQGKVIGVEYMFTLAMLNASPNRRAAPDSKLTLRYDTPNLMLFGQKIDHLTISYMPDGHDGFKVPHYDYHFYFVSPADRYKIVLNIPPPPAAAPMPADKKPSDAVRESDIVPAMGAHWSVKANEPFGPVYTIDKAGKDVALEYEYNHNKMRSYKVAEGPPGSPLIWVCDIDYVPIGQVLNHFTVTFLPGGATGNGTFEFQLHLYKITPEDRAKITP